MKHIAMILLLAILGLKAQAQPHSYTVEVNSQPYTVTEQNLNDYFGETFQYFVSKNICKTSDFELWKESFEGWKYMASQGRYKFTTYGSIIGSVDYAGQTDSKSIGLDEKGKSAKGNPNKEKNLAVRMAYLNHFMAKYIINNVAGGHVR